MPQELEKVMEALLQAHVFPDHLTLQREAFRALLMLRPELRIEGAIALYRQGESSFARAAELCGLSQEELKHILAARGIPRSGFCSVRDDLSTSRGHGDSSTALG